MKYQLQNMSFKTFIKEDFSCSSSWNLSEFIFHGIYLKRKTGYVYPLKVTNDIRTYMSSMFCANLYTIKENIFYPVAKHRIT